MEDQDEQDRDAAVLLVGIVISMAAVGSAFSTAAIKRQILRGIIIPSARQPGADTSDSGRMHSQPSLSSYIPTSTSNGLKASNVDTVR